MDYHRGDKIMKRISLKKHILLMLCLTLFAITSCKACDGCKKKNKEGETMLSSEKAYVGTHQIIANKTGKMITSSGHCSYQIVLPKDYSTTLFQAASELRYFIHSASLANIEIVEEKDKTSDHVLSFVEPTFEIDKSQLGSNGYRIKTNQEDVYFIANTDCGKLNAVYGFLEETIHLNTYAVDEVDYTTKDVELLDFDVIDVPDIDYRVGDVTTKIDGDSTYRMRLKLNSDDDVFAYVNGTLYHNSLYYFPVEDYSDEAHKVWYSETDGVTDYKQLCYSCHGNAEMKKEMLEKAADLIVQALQEFQADNVTFMQSDVNSWCTCEECQKEHDKYGTDSAVMIHFLNELVTYVDKELKEKNMQDRNYHICFFAYQKTEKAPVIENEDGTYSPIDSSVVLSDKVCVFYAPIYADYTESFTSENNVAYSNTLKAWNAISKECFVWLYQTNFSHYLYPYNSLPTMQERYNFLANQNAMFVFDQNQWDQGTKTSFHRLKAWMSAKLSWNVNLNYQDLLQDYFDRYFYSASDTMKTLFDEITLHMENLSQTTDISGDIYNHVNQYKYFSKPLLDHWMDLIDKSYEAIEQYKTTDPELYEKLSTRIGIEAMSIRYMDLELYASRYSTDELRTLQNEFMQDCFKYGIDKIAEITDISTIFEQWGIL
jgi:hypothetical protein